ncbi:MAG: MFS transporter [Clostridiales bacterium]|nr:MFS transporter [Clostridiales bacterium]
MNNPGHKIRRVLNAKYAGIQGLYYGSLAPVTAFASAYLLHQGLDNSQIGVVIALGSAGAVLLQTALGSLVSEERRLSLRRTVFLLLLLLLGLSLALCAGGFPLGLTMAIYVCLLTLAQALLPLVSSMNFMFEARGITLNFGMSRAAGSVAYAALSPVIGWAAARFSGASIPWFSALTYGGMLLLVAGFALGPAAQKALPLCCQDRAARLAAASANARGFFRRNPGYLAFLAGVTLLFVNLSATQTFFLQILRAKGGDGMNLGIATAIGAAAEIPMMLAFSWLSRKVQCATLIRVSALFFTLKTVGIFLAQDIGSLYLAQVLHMLGYALFIPAGVYYVDRRMAEGDKVKGQAYLGSTMALGGIAASLAGGPLLDAFGPQVLLQCAIVLSALGTVIVMWATGARCATCENMV